MYIKQFVKSRCCHSLFLLLGLFLGLTLTGCTINPEKDNTAINTKQTPVDTDKAKSQDSLGQKDSGQQPTSSSQPASSPIPEKIGQLTQELTPELLYDLMLAEIALQRKNYSLAFEKYFTAAKKTRDGRLAKKATRVTLFSKNDVQTFKAVELWSELDPSNIDVQQIYASSLITQKKDVEAILYLQKVINLSDTFELGIKRVVALLEPIEERERASQIFSTLTETHKHKPIVKLYQAKLALKFADYSAAEKYLNEVLMIKPDYLDALVLKVDLLKKQKRDLQAIQILEKIVVNLPENVPLRLELARLLVANKHYEQGLQQVRILIRKDLAPEVLFAISLLAIEMDKLDDAKKYLESLHMHRLYASEAAYFIGQLEAGRGKYAEAEDWFKRVKHGKYTFEAYLGLAMVYSQQKKFAQAFKLLEHSKASNDKQSIDVLQIKAEVYAQAKNYSKAYEVYTEALKLSPDNHDLLYGRGMLAEKFGRIDLLEKDLHTIIAANPKDNQALNALGYTLVDRTDRYQEGRQYIERALKIDPEDVATLDSMGWVLHKMGENQEALIYLKKAYEKDPDPEIAAHYGEVLWVLGQTSKAKSIWKQALKKNPKHQVLVGITTRYLK